MSTFKPNVAGTREELRGIFAGGQARRPGNAANDAILEKFAKEVEKLAKKYALVGYGANPTRPERGGELRDSIKVSVDPGGLGVRIEARRFRTYRGVTYDVARIIHQGHGPIRPRRAKRLRFQQRGGKYVVAKSVRQVGEYPFLVRALKEANDHLPRDRRFLIRTTKGLSGAPPARAKF